MQFIWIKNIFCNEQTLDPIKKGRQEREGTDTSTRALCILQSWINRRINLSVPRHEIQHPTHKTDLILLIHIFIFKYLLICKLHMLCYNNVVYKMLKSMIV